MSKGWFNEEDDHIVLIRSDGSVVYEDGYDLTRYCDIYYCYECPRYGDDCDGKEDNMTKKKSTPEGALIPQDNGTTSGEKSEAERLFDRIGTGAYYAVTRPKDAKVDRQLRRLIENANNNDDCIINVGFGYFRPGDDDSDDFELYLASERSKVRSRLKTLSKMERTYDRRYQ